MLKLVLVVLVTTCLVPHDAAKTTKDPQKYSITVTPKKEAPGLPADKPGTKKDGRAKADFDERAYPDDPQVIKGSKLLTKYYSDYGPDNDNGKQLILRQVYNAKKEYVNARYTRFYLKFQSGPTNCNKNPNYSQSYIDNNCRLQMCRNYYLCDGQVVSDNYNGAVYLESNTNLSCSRYGPCDP